ncbi:M81 family metallopeptidase [Actinopolymorpha sp. B11F2]|uniref:M81 family metallopeptidase n=1 Tax=Actinopolymorpha sp. B11F2 TaxID=3160862 RepID=UPI0032E47048
MVRLAAVGLVHEANTFAPSRVDLVDFAADGILRGPEIVDRHGDADTTMAGFLAAGSAPGVEVVPLVFTTTTPGGPITPEALETLADEILTTLAETGPWDGVLAALHGAAVAEHRDDADGYLLRQVRVAVGPDTVVGAALDLHANLSAAVCAYADIVTTHRTNPHVDARLRAEELAALVVRTARDEIRPSQALVQVPAALGILAQNTGEPPMREILAGLDEVLASPGVLTASVAQGYPYADVPHMGMATLVVTDGDPSAARSWAAALARQVWSRRHEFSGRSARLAEALHRAATATKGPVLLLDIGDNIGAGAPGDSVVIVAAARQVGLTGLLAILVDADGVTRCHRAGTGGRVELLVGARTDPRVGPPLAVGGVVRRLHSGRYEDPGPTHAGHRHYDAGPTAVVEVDGGPTLVLTTRPTPPTSLVQLTCLGLDPTGYRAIVAKGVHAPLAAYAPLATEIIAVDTPGVTSVDLRRLSYRRRRYPLWPFEQDVTFG